MAQTRVIGLDPVTNTIESDKLPTSYLQEVARDAVAAALRTAGPVSVTHDDNGNTITLTVTATANSSDAQLRDRGTHTGFQSTSTITDFNEAVRDTVAAFLAQGTGVTLTHNDAGDTLTVQSTGGGTGGVADPEAVRDIIGASIVALGNISVAVNDAADTITFTTSATQNDTDANLRDRATHTGTQPISSVADLQAALDDRATSDALQILLAEYAAANHSHDFAALTGAVSLAQLPNGGTFFIRWDAAQNAGAGAWVYNGLVVTTRPTTRTSIIMQALGGSQAPSFALQHDMWYKEVTP